MVLAECGRTVDVDAFVTVVRVYIYVCVCIEREGGSTGESDHGET